LAFTVIAMCFMKIGWWYRNEYAYRFVW